MTSLLHRAPWVALLAGLLFAVHPAHVEAVAPIVGRKELLSTTLVLAALLVAFSGRGAARTLGRLAASVGLGALAILANEGAAVFPLLYGIVAVAVPGATGILYEPGLVDGKARRALLRALAVSVVPLLYLVPYLVLRGMPRGVPLEAQWLAGVPRSTVTYTTSRILAEYVRLLSFPGFLGTDFAYAARVQFISRPGTELLLSMLAWLPLVVDALALWESEIAKAPRDVVVNNNLAVAYSARGEYARAISPLEAAIRIAPGYWRAHVNLGIAEQGLGRLERARTAYLEAIRIAPREADPLFFYARFQAAEGDLEGAVLTLAAARRIAPEQARLATAQGRHLATLGRADEARATYRAALAIDPADVEARDGLAALPP